MFGANNYQQYQQELRKIRDELEEIYSQLGHRLFNKLSKDEGVNLLHKAENAYRGWHEKLRTEDWRAQGKVLRKYRRDLEKTEILIEKIRLRLKKKGVSLSSLSIAGANETAPNKAQQLDIKQETIAETKATVVEVKKPQQKVSRPPNKANDPVGYVRGLQMREEVKRTVDGIFRMVTLTLNFQGYANHKVRHVWSFSLDVPDKYGNLWYSIPVIVRGNKIKGGFSEGDLVRVYGNYEAGQVLETDRIYNESTRSAVKVTSNWQRI